MQQAEQDALKAGLVTKKLGLEQNGKGAKAYGEAIGVYLSFVISRMADYGSSICSWNAHGEAMRNTFARQAIPMVWIMLKSTLLAIPRCWNNNLTWVTKCLRMFSCTMGSAVQRNAVEPNGLENALFSTDPPYYDNIGYADLSDFFYVWLRRSLHEVYPNLFATMLVPKQEELIASPYRHGDSDLARDF